MCVEFKYLEPTKIAQWIRVRHKEENIKIEPDVINYFIECCGPSMNSINSEFDKLCSLCKDNREISRKDIDETITRTINTVIFSMIDNMASKKRKETLQQLDDLLYTNEPIQKIIIMLAKHFNILLEYRQLQDLGYKRDDIIQRLGIKPYFAGKYSSQAGNFTTQKLKEIIESFYLADIKTKTTKFDSKIELERLICNL
jgi:DNA polymerase-3 subunit delta